MLDGVRGPSALIVTVYPTLLLPAATSFELASTSICVLPMWHFSTRQTITRTGS
jgi:hypothetical protein